MLYNPMEVKLMKVFEIAYGHVHRDVSSRFSTAQKASKHFAPNIVFVDAPDNVFPGWGYNPNAVGNARFIKPEVGEGQEYNPETGEVWDPEDVRAGERASMHAATTNDTRQALRKIREGDTSIDWSKWLDMLDAYNVAIEDTKNQKDYPLKVVYPDYPKKPTK